MGGRVAGQGAACDRKRAWAAFLIVVDAAAIPGGAGVVCKGALGQHNRAAGGDAVNPAAVAGSGVAGKRAADDRNCRGGSGVDINAAAGHCRAVLKHAVLECHADAGKENRAACAGAAAGVAVFNGQAADDGACLAGMQVKAPVVAGAVTGCRAAAVNNGAGRAALGDERDVFAAKIQIDVSGSGVSAGRQSDRVAVCGGIDGRLNGRVLR